MKRATSIAVVAVALSGCGRHAGGPSPEASSSAAAVTRAGPAPAAPSASADKDVAPPTGGSLMAKASCRAIAVKGKVTAEDGKSLFTGAPLDKSGYVDVAGGASLAVKNTETSRELVFEGPGHVLSCERGEERFLMVDGSVETATWAGARPGAEVLIATPFGAVRYGDAKLEVKADSKTLSVVSESGDAWVWLAGAPSEEKIPAGKRFEKRGRAPDVKSLVVDCEKHAADAEARARAVLVPGKSTAPLGARAAEHVRARKAARVSCAIASVAVQNEKTDAEKDELGKRVSYADARWRSVPPRVDPAEKVESR